MKRMLAVWSSLWFTKVRRHPLGLLRLVLCAWCVYRHVPQVLARARWDAPLDSALYTWNLGSRITLLPYPPEGGWLTVYGLALYVTGIAACVGLGTRLALAVFGFLLLYGFSGFASHDMFNHEQVLTAQLLLVLSIAPGIKAWSVDRACAVRRQGRQTSWKRWTRHMQGPPVERWGLQLVFVLLVVVYMGAGVSKVRFSEGQWFNGQTLTYYLSGQQTEEIHSHGQIFFGDPALVASQTWKDNAALVEHGYGYGAHPVARELAKRPRVMAMLATCTIVFELLAFVLLFGQPWRNAYLLGALAMHTSIGYAMQLPFHDYRIILLCLIDWPALLRSMRFRSDPGERVNSRHAYAVRHARSA